MDFCLFSCEFLMVSIKVFKYGINVFFLKVMHDQNGDSFSNKLLCLAILFKNKFLLFCNTQLSSFWNSFLPESFSVKA